MRTLIWILSAIWILHVVPALAATPQDIGTAAVTTNSVTGRVAAAERALKPGDRVYQNETVVTGKGAGAQLLFRDETALTMGADSTVVLDTLIYDPNQRAGKMTIRAVSGAFRFISGSGPKNGYQIETPLGTIGVRGTILQFWLRPDQLKLQLDEGGAFFCVVPPSRQGARDNDRRGAGTQRCVELDRPGTYVLITRQQIGETKSVAGPASTQSILTNNSIQPQYQQFMDTLKAPPPPPPPPPSTGVLPNGTLPHVPIH